MPDALGPPGLARHTAIEPQAFHRVGVFDSYWWKTDDYP
jgi:hypothetical protein